MSHTERNETACFNVTSKTSIEHFILVICTFIIKNVCAVAVEFSPDSLGK